MSPVNSRTKGAACIATFCVTILGEPVGQGRPRAVRRGPHVRMHSAPKSAEWEALAAQQMAGAWDWPPIDSPVCVTVLAYSARPKSLPKREGTGRLWCVRKPDLDNVVKAALDALVKGGVIADDAQVASLRAEGYVCAVGEVPRVEIGVDVLEALPVVPWPAKRRTA